MQFTILPPRTLLSSYAGSHCYLISDNWDDYGYKTQFLLIYVDNDGTQHEIGAVKIGRFDMSDDSSPEPPSFFTDLPDDFFSLGQDDSYYENLGRLGDVTRDSVLLSLRDVAIDKDLFAKALQEKVTGISLLRGLSPTSVQGQFRRLALGGARLSRYAFVYEPPGSAGFVNSLSFAVEPGSNPPSNVHVVIGRNGVGKTHLLHQIAQAVVTQNVAADHGRLLDMESSDSSQFANLVSVSFSAFDEFQPISTKRNKSEGIHYAYVGLKTIGKSDGQELNPKTPAQLAREFATSARLCRQVGRAGRWRRCLEALETDPIFSDARIASIAPGEEDGSLTDPELLIDRASKKYKGLSSGHKIVLLTITRLVETVEERSLVLLDEPEAHLHPPLLAAFIRALSDLLTNRNGVAIIATHSPVVLQEVPRNCVWRLQRSGTVLSAQRPEVETFGENVGVLTREIFGLELTHSGFHRLLAAAAEAPSYPEAVNTFGGQLGGEARAILRAMFEERHSQPRA